MGVASAPVRKTGGYSQKASMNSEWDLDIKNPSRKWALGERVSKSEAGTISPPQIWLNLTWNFAFTFADQSSEKDVEILRSLGESDQKEVASLRNRSTSGAVWPARKRA